MEENRRKYVTMEPNRITFHYGQAGTFLGGLVLIGLFAGLFFLYIEKPPSRETPWEFAAMIAITLFPGLPGCLYTFFFGLRHLRYSVVFDGDARELRESNLFGFIRTVPFSEIGAIRKVSVEGSDKEFFKVVRKGRLFERGWRLTPDKSLGDEAIHHIATVVLPAVNTMIFGDALGSEAIRSRPDPAALWDLRHYSLADGAYVLNVPRSITGPLVFLICVSVILIFRYSIISVSVVSIYTIYRLCTAERIVLDTENKVIRFEKRFFRTTMETIPFDRYLSVEESDQPDPLYPPFINIRYKSHSFGESERLLARSYSRQKLGEIAAETESIILSAVGENSGKDTTDM